VLLDSATTAGARLAIPSLATPIGGLVAGVVMSRWGRLIPLVRTGAFLMVFGNALVTSLGFVESRWKYFVYIFPANLGQGIVYPGILFTSLATFDHAGELCTASFWGLHEGADNGSRPCSFCVHDIPRTVSRDCVWRGRNICYCADDAQCPSASGLGRYPRQTKGENVREDSNEERGRYWMLTLFHPSWSRRSDTLCQ